MRRLIGGTAILLGVLALVLGLGAGRIYDRVAVVPLDQKTTAVSEGTGVSILRVWRDGGAVKFDELNDQRVRNTRVVRGIPGKVPEDQRDQNAFWQLGLKTEIVDVAPVIMSVDGVSIDRHTGMSTNCCGDTVSTGTIENPSATEDIRHEGLFFKFPFDAQKQNYPFWDQKLKGTEDARFIREEQLQGINTYVYEQNIPNTRLPGEQQVPRAMFGTGTGNVTAHQEYANIRTFWVEPNTGIIIRAQEDIDQRAVSEAGTVTIARGVIGYTPETQAALAAEYGPKGRQLSFIQNDLRTIGIGLGALLLAVGLALLFWTRRESYGRIEDRPVSDDRIEHEDRLAHDDTSVMEPVPAGVGRSGADGVPRGARKARPHDDSVRVRRPHSAPDSSNDVPSGSTGAGRA
ncbi:DUF3068 domain-containing protein [Mobilicoccus sp.]|uniref:DUF3068 domain-containing protein n=1 Tax=Mobilicoccus sp. TaxID=2034349 RepID=UPI0028A9A98B|nr:DUF3068 domain-containing protein [Mobilicoccus sp.]